MKKYLLAEIFERRPYVKGDFGAHSTSIAIQENVFNMGKANFSDDTQRLRSQKVFFSILQIHKFRQLADDKVYLDKVCSPLAAEQNFLE